MPFYILTKDGELLSVETHVGEGFTVVEVKPLEQRASVDMEPEEQQQ